MSRKSKYIWQKQAKVWPPSYVSVDNGERCGYKCGATSPSIRFQTFMVGNLLVSYQYHGRIESPPSQCPKRVVLKVWRF